MSTRRRQPKKAILVLESPWEMDDWDANRTSVIPFIEGVAKQTDDTEAYYANFYDKNSFSKALDCLCKSGAKSRVVYIAAHGLGEKVLDVHMLKLLYIVALKSKDYRIDGVLIGSCFVGKNSTTMEACIEDSNLRWCIGYNAATYWLDGTLIDCKLLAELSTLKESDFNSQKKPVQAIQEALSLFSPDAVIGEDMDDNDVVLSEGMNFVLQLRGQGHRARNITETVWAEEESGD